VPPDTKTQKTQWEKNGNVSPNQMQQHKPLGVKSKKKYGKQLNKIKI